MKLINNIAFLTMSILLINCSKKEVKYFTAQEIDWKIEIPSKWTIENQSVLNQNIKQGEQLIKKTVDKDFELGGKEISLITFRKNTLSKLQASIIPFKESYKGEWYDKYPLIKEYIFNVFKSQSVIVDTTSNTENISGVTFEVFNLKISKHNRAVMEQNMYRTYINGYDFIINITSDKPLYKKQLIQTLRNSKFKNNI
ncbi:hypothetical protein [Psychroserpens sp. NJDZ02]|uniref:hypothetical protein n=1 Tax=Psychroserpens sp. NJDZ02 TaxID=2570561 RepID=UPI0010A8DAFC|nr:hypothetical protein [Psychroserpens sp. NJDZ02]QCE43180.1 hypothetical protein E9099_17740 [Psychroserpens sp. NJDZ02]